MKYIFFLFSKQNVYNCPAANASERGDSSALLHVRDNEIFSQLFVFFFNQGKEKQVLYYVYLVKRIGIAFFLRLPFLGFTKVFGFLATLLYIIRNKVIFSKFSGFR